MRRKRLVKKEPIKVNFTPEISNNIGIIIPTTSNKRNYTNVENIDFFNIMYKSFLKTMDKNKKYNYNFYLAYDDDDTYYINNKEKIITHFKSLNPDNNIELHCVSNMKSKVGQIWSHLANIAKEKNHFLYQLGDDIELLSTGWEDKFITNLQETNYIGVTGPFDVNQPRFLTQTFVHRIHLEIFGSYFPPQIVNWYIDNWIQDVYGGKQDRSINVRNKGGPPRYNVLDNRSNYLKVLKESKITLEEYLTKHKKSD